jgi:hypothetical protein
MSQPFLDLGNVGRVFQGIRSCSRPQGVYAETSHAQPNPPGIFLHNPVMHCTRRRRFVRPQRRSLLGLSGIEVPPGQLYDWLNSIAKNLVSLGALMLPNGALFHCHLLEYATITQLSLALSFDVQFRRDVSK